VCKECNVAIFSATDDLDPRHFALLGPSVQQAPASENGTRTNQPLIKGQKDDLTPKKGTLQHPNLRSPLQIRHPFFKKKKKTSQRPRSKLAVAKSLNPQFNYLFLPQN